MPSSTPVPSVSGSAKRLAQPWIPAARCMPCTFRRISVGRGPQPPGWMAMATAVPIARIASHVITSTPKRVGGRWSRARRSREGRRGRGPPDAPLAEDRVQNHRAGRDHDERCTQPNCVEQGEDDERARGCGTERGLAPDRLGAAASIQAQHQHEQPPGGAERTSCQVVHLSALADQRRDAGRDETASP
jgi:hypothetical protein